MRWELAPGRFAVQNERQWPCLSRPSLALSVLGMCAKALDAPSTISIISHHHFHQSTRGFFVLSLHALDSRIMQLLAPHAALSSRTASSLSVKLGRLIGYWRGAQHMRVAPGTWRFGPDLKVARCPERVPR